DHQGVDGLLTALDGEAQVRVELRDRLGDQRLDPVQHLVPERCTDLGQQLLPPLPEPRSASRRVDAGVDRAGLDRLARALACSPVAAEELQAADGAAPPRRAEAECLKSRCPATRRWPTRPVRRPAPRAPPGPRPAPPAARSAVLPRWLAAAPAPPAPGCARC